MTQRITDKLAHNASFELAVLSNLGLIGFAPEQWRCTMVHALGLGLPGGLDAVAAELALAERKSDSNKSLIAASPCRPEDLGAPARADDPRWQEFVEYCRRTCAPSVLSISTSPSCAPCPSMSGTCGTSISASTPAAARGPDPGASGYGGGRPQPPPLDRCGARPDRRGQPQFPQPASDLAALPGGHARRPDRGHRQGPAHRRRPAVARARRAREPAAVGLLEHRQIRSPGPGHRHGWPHPWNIPKLRRPHRTVERATVPTAESSPWHLVRPGRHDRPRPGAEGDFELLDLLYDDHSKLLASLLRSTIVAPPGKQLVVADLFSIESVALAWLAGSEYLLHLFREGRDPYKDFATRLFNIPYDQATKNNAISVSPLPWAVGSASVVPASSATRRGSVWC